MMIQKLATKIVQEVRKLIDEDIIVVNTDGVIIASTIKERIGTFHEGAKLVLQHKEKLIIKQEDEQTLQGVRSGINLPVFFQGEVVGVIGITGNPDKVSPFGEIIKKMTELLINESYYSEQLDWQSRQLEAFVFDWIQLREWDNVFLEKARLLTIDLSKQRIAVIAEFYKDGLYVTRNMWDSILGWKHLMKDDVIVRLGNNRIVLLLGINKEIPFSQLESKLEQWKKFLQEQLQTNISIGVGQRSSAKLLKESYRQAERAVKMANRKAKIIYDDKLTLEILFDDITSETRGTFLSRTIHPLLEEKELLKTIREFFRQNQSLKYTAKALHIHINTLHYRLTKIERLTNLSVNQLHDLVSLYIGICLLDEHTK